MHIPKDNGYKLFTVVIYLQIVTARYLNNIRKQHREKQLVYVLDTTNDDLEPGGLVEEHLDNSASYENYDHLLYYRNADRSIQSDWESDRDTVFHSYEINEDQYSAEKPILIEQQSSIEYYNRGSDVSRSEESPDIDRDSYNLYSILRAAEDRSQLDSSIQQEIEATKQALRYSLRARCRALDHCIQRCGWTRQRSCQQNCKRNYDKRNICEETTTTCPTKTTTAITDTTTTTEMTTTTTTTTMPPTTSVRSCPTTRPKCPNSCE